MGLGLARGGARTWGLRGRRNCRGGGGLLGRDAGRPSSAGGSEGTEGRPSCVHARHYMHWEPLSHCGTCSLTPRLRRGELGPPRETHVTRSGRAVMEHSCPGAHSKDPSAASLSSPCPDSLNEPLVAPRPVPERRALLESALPAASRPTLDQLMGASMPGQWGLASARRTGRHPPTAVKEKGPTEHGHLSQECPWESSCLVYEPGSLRPRPPL